ncbi:hypothetical protein RSAG8_12187, partial [Rhizoctonia solani AG-8 WAC10335]
VISSCAYITWDLGFNELSTMTDSRPKWSGRGCPAVRYALSVPVMFIPKRASDVRTSTDD